MARILIADDQPSLRQMLSDLIGNAGYDFVLAENGQEAVALAVREKPDLIIMDLMMPGKNGIEAAREIKDNPDCAGTKILFLTARGQPQDEQRALDAGGDGFISKPFSPKLLLQRVEALLGG